MIVNILKGNDGPGGVSSNTIKDHPNTPSLISCNKVTVDDVLYCCCKRLLYHLMVLNYGHVVLQSCINITEERTLNCQVFQWIHPGD